jgi:hypothetical protein
MQVAAPSRLTWDMGQQASSTMLTTCKHTSSQQMLYYIYSKAAAKC